MSDERLELAIDTASDMASIALSRQGALLAELTWHCGREHSRQLIPAIDSLLQRAGTTKEALSAIFVDIGPGSYAGVRSGVSSAKALAFGLQVPLAGVGRLEIEAYAFAATGATIDALHRAGRNDIAWAAYMAEPSWRELVAPGLTPRTNIAANLPSNALIVGEIDDDLSAELVDYAHHVTRGNATVRRAALLAELGWRRLEAGRTDDPKSLVPLYLREPAIGPQKP
jgi:tRNA threonylcarbamoyladenosine biosynthesis protein TsaB